MLPPPMTREWARNLVASEAVASTTSGQTEPATVLVYEKLRRQLCAPVGLDGFRALASRALALARSEAPSLSAARISEDGTLEGLAEFEPRIDIDRVRAGEFPAGKEGTALIARLLSLLYIFLGEALTLSLLGHAWPGGAFDDRNSGNGSKA